MKEIKRGDILMVELPNNENSNIQSGFRPVLVVQNNIGNRYSPTVIVVPLTSKIKKLEMPTHELIEEKEAIGLKVNSMVLCEQITTIDKKKVKNKIGRVLSNEVMEKVTRACAISLAI